MPENKTKAVIWDMDGVIVDTGPYHFAAWRGVFQKRGVEFTEADFKRHFGQRNDTIIRDALGQDMSQDDVYAIAREKEASFRDIARGRVKPLPGVINLMRSLTEHGFKMALASSAPIENIKFLLGGLGIEDCFEVIITGRDVTEGKPSPQGFLLAAQKLGVKPENCIVVEDAIAGVAAARRARMHCLAITNTHPRARLSEAGLIVDTLEAVSVNDLEGLLRLSNKGKELKVERSLVLIKPDGMQRGLAGTIIARLEGQGLKLVALKMLHMDKALAERHYAVHTDKPFFQGLVDYITSTPIIAAVFEGNEAVQMVRKVMGATDPAKAEKGTIRGDFGLDIQRNAVHGSDSVENGEKEIRLFFAEDEIFDYHRGISS